MEYLFRNDGGCDFRSYPTSSTTLESGRKKLCQSKDIRYSVVLILNAFEVVSAVFTGRLTQLPVLNGSMQLAVHLSSRASL